MKTKYLHTSKNIINQIIEDENGMRTGFYLWAKAFDGDIIQWSNLNKSTLKTYDIIHVNLAPADLGLIQEIRDIIGYESNTRLIATADHSVEAFGNVYDFGILKTCLKLVDEIIACELQQKRTLELITGREVHHLWNPAAVNYLKSLDHAGLSPDWITVVAHKYKNYHNHYPALAVKDFNNVQLAGYDGKDPQHFNLTQYYQRMVQENNWFQWIRLLCESSVVYDPHLMKSQGRIGFECASLRTPLIISDRSETSLLYPYTTVDPYDVKAAKDLIIRLQFDNSFVHKVTEYAYKEVENYKLSKSLKRIADIIYNNDTM